MKVLVTGGAGFIGSHITERLLNHPNILLVRVVDNLSTGSLKNINVFFSNPKFEFVKCDIRNFSDCRHACKDITAICHQAALGSVPRSIQDPLTTNEVNITGTLHIFVAAKEYGIKRIVYAASSSTYGDHPGLPKVEDKTGNPLSPYAVTKLVNELYARVFASVYDMEFIGLRYFNIFGPRQNPKGPYAAVIPLFIKAVLSNQSPVINGDGSHSRDFTYVDNAVQANLAALFTENKEAINQVYNIACGEQTSLLQLFNYLKEISNTTVTPIHGPERMGDVKHSLADISKAIRLLNYKVEVKIREGLEKTFEWYKNNPSCL
ncbi:MAG: SDR family oxidoreductase [Chitinophagaceae bacterium]|nr:SDR family oxidoreductase [Chitinophagaceae bacterium]